MHFVCVVSAVPVSRNAREAALLAVVDADRDSCLWINIVGRFPPVLVRKGKPTDRNMMQSALRVSFILYAMSAVSDSANHCRFSHVEYHISPTVKDSFGQRLGSGSR